MNKITTPDFSIENLNPQLATIYPQKDNIDYTGFDTNLLVLDFGKKKKGDLTTCNLLFKSDKYQISSTGASCGCTRPTFIKIEEGLYQITVDFDSSKIANNVSKYLTVYLNNNTKSIKINLVINKP